MLLLAEHGTMSRFQPEVKLTLITLIVVFLPYCLCVYQPCPLLRAYYPHAPRSGSLEKVLQELESIFDGLVEKGYNEDFGSVTPNTTSFSVVLFSDRESNDSEDESIIFQYHHTAESSLNQGRQQGNVSADTVFPAGSLTQLFTVYAWLIEMGDGHWVSPIIDFLPELNNSHYSAGLEAGVDWQSITIGALASQMAGIARDSSTCELDSECDSTGTTNATYHPLYSWPLRNSYSLSVELLQPSTTILARYNTHSIECSFPVTQLRA